MGSASPLLEPCHPCPLIHGEDFLGDLTPALPAPPSLRVEEAAAATTNAAVSAIVTELMRDEYDDNNGALLLALAPLTNIALALQKEPRIAVKSK